MVTLTKFTTPQIEIGEYVNVLTGFSNNGAVIANTLGQFIRANNIYNQADYPELYARIGRIGMTSPNVSPYYNANTQFYVPPYNMSALGLTLPTYGANSAPQYTSYVRSK